MAFSWEPLAGGVWRSRYRTPSGIESNTYAFPLVNGDIAVVSPPIDPDDASFAATEALGPVTALVAQNTGHDLGQAAWQARYPQAVSYAPSVAGPKIARAKKGLRPVRPLSELAGRLPPGAHLVDVPATRSGMTMLSWPAEGGQRLLFLDEIVTNSPKLPRPAIVGLVFWLARSGPGLARNHIWSSIFVSDRREVARAVLAEIEARPPTTVLLSHGDPVGLEQLSTLRSLLDPMAR